MGIRIFLNKSKNSFLVTGVGFEPTGYFYSSLGERDASSYVLPGVLHLF